MTLGLSGTSPFVSIGMPVYNGANYIDKAIASILNQTYTNFELIISDNHSTDSTCIICEQASQGDSRIKVVRQERNTGAIANFQFVLHEAKGDLFMWAAHDDIWDPNWLSNAIKSFTQGVAMVTSEIIGIDESDKVISRPLCFDYSGSKFIRTCKYFLAREWKGKANAIYSLIRIDLAKGFRFPSEDKSYGFDMHFVYYLLCKGKCVFVNGRALYKRVPNFGKSQVSPNQLTYLEVFKREIGYVFQYVTLGNNLFIVTTTFLLIPMKIIDILLHKIRAQGFINDQPY